MKLADSRAPKLSQLTNISAELRVECIHSPEQGLPFRLIDLPRRGPSGGMNGGWSQICMGLLNHKWRPEMQSLYYKSLYFEGLGPTFPRDTATIGLRVIGKGSDAKTPGSQVMCIKVESLECEASLNSLVLEVEENYKVSNQCILSLASKDTPDLYLTLDISWRFLPLDDLWRNSSRYF